MASFDGFDLGLVFEMSTAPAPKARQINAYPGANGLEVLDHGSRGGTTIVSGAFGGANAAALATIVQGMRAKQVAGGASTLVDLFGVAWGGVILVQFATTGRVYRGAAGGGYFVRYQAQFLHVL